MKENEKEARITQSQETKGSKCKKRNIANEIIDRYFEGTNACLSRSSFSLSLPFLIPFLDLFFPSSTALLRQAERFISWFFPFFSMYSSFAFIRYVACILHPPTTTAVTVEWTNPASNLLLPLHAIPWTVIVPVPLYASVCENMLRGMYESSRDSDRRR